VHVEYDGKVLFLDPFCRRHYDSEHAANVKITRKTVTRLHAARAIANTYFRFWVRINVSHLRRLHYHRFRGSLYNVSFVSGKRNLTRCYFRNISRDPYITVNYAELYIDKFQYADCILRSLYQIYPIPKREYGFKYCIGEYITELFWIGSPCRHCLYYIHVARNVDKKFVKIIVKIIRWICYWYNKSIIRNL